MLHNDWCYPFLKKKIKIKVINICRCIARGYVMMQDFYTGNVSNTHRCTPDGVLLFCLCNYRGLVYPQERYWCTTYVMQVVLGT